MPRSATETIAPGSALRVPRSTTTPSMLTGRRKSPPWLGGPSAAGSTAAPSPGGGGGGGGGGSSTCSITKWIVVSTVIGPGLPSISAGSKTYCSAAATAASSKPSPWGVMTSTAVTMPSASIERRTGTWACLPAARAAGGYSGATAWSRTGALVTTGAGAGAGAAGGSRRS
jgi:hypothetical protein